MRKNASTHSQRGRLLSGYGTNIIGNNRITMMLANGTAIEFEVDNTERFALQALSLRRKA